MYYISVDPTIYIIMHIHSYYKCDSQWDFDLTVVTGSTHPIPFLIPFGQNLIPLDAKDVLIYIETLLLW